MFPEFFVQLKWSLSKDVFERHMSIVSGLFFFHFWTVAFPNFWTNRLYNSKDTQEYKFGSIKVISDEKEQTSG